MKIKTIIVEDEPSARSNLRNKLLHIDSDIQIVAEVSTVKEAKDTVTQYQPDLIFLDITLPEENGFTLLEQIDYSALEVIFVTAHDEYAIKAFEFCAAGYILKPIDNSFLVQAVNSAKKKIRSKYSKDTISNLRTYLRSGTAKLAIPVEDGVDFVNDQDIIYLEADGSYTNIVRKNDRRIISSKNLAYFKTPLEFKAFFQSHRSYIINLKYVEKYTKKGLILMEGGKEIPISRSRKDEFILRIQS